MHDEDSSSAMTTRLPLLLSFRRSETTKAAPLIRTNPSRQQVCITGLDFVASSDAVYWIDVSSPLQRIPQETRQVVNLFSAPLTGSIIYVLLLGKT